MRISTGMIYDNALASMQNRTSGLLKSQQQISAGRRMLTPSDDPVAAARALEVTQAQAVNNSQATTRNNVKSTLGIIDGQIDSASLLMQRVRELTVQAGDAALAASDRKSIATELRARFQEMVALANSRDGNGLYLFGGYQTNNQPFAGSVENGVVYSGDDGARALRVSGSRDLQISDSGNNIFMNIKNGNGVFATAAQSEKSANAAQVKFEGYNSLAAAPANTGSLELRFWVDSQGGVKTPGQGVGRSATLPPIPLTYTNGVDNQFIVNIDGGAPTLIDLDPVGPATVYADTQAVVDAIQAGIGAAATVSLDAHGQLVVTSATTGATSSIAFSGNAANALVGTTPAYTNGITGAAGQTYYDLVDGTGSSLFTKTVSATGINGTYTHAFTSGQPISLDNPGLPPAPPADYGANLIFTGAPQQGDVFTLARTPTALTVTPKALIASGARAVIDGGTVSDATKWAQAANGGNFEVRFWVDTQGDSGSAGATYYDLVNATDGNSMFTGKPSSTNRGFGQMFGTAPATPGGVGLQGFATGSAVPANPTVITAGVNDKFQVAVDGNAAVTVTLPAGSYAPGALATQMQTSINAALPTTPVAVTLNGSNQLVVTSNTVGATSAVTLASANTYTHAFTSGVPIALSSPGGGGQPAFDFGAAVTVSGIPAGGDAFTIKADTAAYYGNGYFVTAAKTTTTPNAGGGVVGVGEVVDVAKWNQPANSRNLEVRFWSDPATIPSVLYYDLVDAETEKSLFSDTASTAGGAGNTYKHKFIDGDSIPFTGLKVPYAGPPPTIVTDFGISLSVNGTPQSGDAFKVQASQSVSVFDTMAQLINSLENGSPAGTSGNTHLSNQLAGALGNLSQIEDNFLKVRASIGSRLAEVDDLDNVGQNLDLQYNQTLSGLQDLDYADAITKLMRQQTELQAAQNSFARISQLSLFDYLK